MFEVEDHAQVGAAVGYFTAALNAFERAVVVLGEHSLTVQVAGHSVLLRCAGRAGLTLCEQAFHHIVSPAQSACNFEICMFDSVSSGIDLPPLPESSQGVRTRGELASFEKTDTRASLDIASKLLQLVEQGKRRALFWTRDFAHVSGHHRAAPLLQTLSWFLETVQVTVAHGAVVGTSRVGVLLAARGGSGKSTVALNCLAQGMNYLSDDYCAVSNPATHEWIAHHLYASGKIAPSNIHRVSPLLQAELRNIGIEKHVAFLANEATVVKNLALKAVCVPMFSTGQARLEPISGLRAMQALALSTVFQTLGNDVERISRLSQLCRDLPCLALYLGDDPAAVPLLLRGWLNDHVIHQPNHLKAVNEDDARENP